jgi:hypothetical protein
MIIATIKKNTTLQKQSGFFIATSFLCIAFRNEFYCYLSSIDWYVFLLGPLVCQEVSIPFFPVS